MSEITLLNRLKTIGRAKAGTRLIACEPVEATADEGGVIKFPVGTKMEMVSSGLGIMIYAVADMGDRLKSVSIHADQFHALEVSPDE